MSKTILLCFFLLFNILAYSAYGSTSTAETGEFRTSKRRKEPKFMYGMIMESSKPGIPRAFPGLHVVQQTRISRKARAVYGGANNIRRPRNGRSSANSYSIKPSSLFMVAFRQLIFGLLLLACLF